MASCWQRCFDFIIEEQKNEKLNGSHELNCSTKFKTAPCLFSAAVAAVNLWMAQESLLSTKRQYLTNHLLKGNNIVIDSSSKIFVQIQSNLWADVALEAFLLVVDGTEVSLQMKSLYKYPKYSAARTKSILSYNNSNSIRQKSRQKVLLTHKQVAETLNHFFPIINLSMTLAVLALVGCVYSDKAKISWSRTITIGHCLLVTTGIINHTRLS